MGHESLELIGYAPWSSLLILTYYAAHYSGSRVDDQSRSGF
jgi:hypothetical protein